MTNRGPSLAVLGLAIGLGGCVSMGSPPAEGPRLTGLDVQASAGGVGALSPAFSEGVSEYAVRVQSDIGEAALVPVARDGSSLITVNGEPVRSGSPARVRLAIGDNTAVVQVKDRSGRSTVCKVTIQREDIGPVVERFTRLVYRDPGTGVTLGCRLFVPDGYDPSKTYPLVLFLHGAGESGSDNEVQLTANQGATVWAKPGEQSRHPCFVLAPQNPKDPQATSPEDFGRMGWTTLMKWGFADPFRPEAVLESVFAVLQKVMAEYSVDADRIYATGLSMGCFGVFALNVAHPDTFAAVVGIAGGLDPARAALLAKKPIWLFHAAGDLVVNVRFSRDSVRALRDAGGKPRYTEFGDDTYLAPNAHLSWIPAYADGEMRDWLFAQSR